MERLLEKKTTESRTNAAPQQNTENSSVMQMHH